MLEEFNENNLKKYIETGLKIVMFYADWCGYCKKQMKVLEEISDVVVGLVNIDENKNLLSTYNISSFPTFIMFKNGIEVTRFSGLHSKSDLMNKLVSFL